MTVYPYIFDYEGQYSFTDLFGLQNSLGVSHFDEMFYLWKFPWLRGTLNEADTAVMKTMVTNWVNFATRGNPDLSWSPIDTYPIHEYMYWNISSSTPEMMHSQEIQWRMEFWNEILSNNGTSNNTFSIYFTMLLLAFVWLE